MIFRGTVATDGRERAVVRATGMQTQMGRIAGMLQAAPTETTPLQKELDRVGKLLGIIVVVIAVVMIATIILVEDVSDFSALFDVLILGVALAVAAVPEGLPAVVTTLLSLGGSRWRSGTPSCTISQRSRRSARRTLSPPTRLAR
jgi:Ca2+-transporting ATPase